MKFLVITVLITHLSRSEAGFINRGYHYQGLGYYPNQIQQQDTALTTHDYETLKAQFYNLGLGTQNQLGRSQPQVCFQVNDKGDSATLAPTAQAIGLKELEAIQNQYKDLGSRLQDLASSNGHGPQQICIQIIGNTASVTSTTMAPTPEARTAASRTTEASTTTEAETTTTEPTTTTTETPTTTSTTTTMAPTTVSTTTTRASPAPRSAARASMRMSTTTRRPNSSAARLRPISYRNVFSFNQPMYFYKPYPTYNIQTAIGVSEDEDETATPESGNSIVAGSVSSPGITLVNALPRSAGTPLARASTAPAASSSTSMPVTSSSPAPTVPTTTSMPVTSSSAAPTPIKTVPIFASPFPVKNGLLNLAALPPIPLKNGKLNLIGLSPVPKSASGYHYPGPVPSFPKALAQYL